MRDSLIIANRDGVLDFHLDKGEVEQIAVAVETQPKGLFPGGIVGIAADGLGSDQASIGRRYRWSGRFAGV